VRDAAHNETLALLEHLSPISRLTHLLLMTAIGTRASPGPAQAVRLLLSTGQPKLKLLVGNLTGRGLAVLTYLGSHYGTMRQRRGCGSSTP
jgi:hypothetical protein